MATWPLKVSAAGSVTVAATLSQMSGWDWGVVFFCSLAGALASLVRRLEKETPRKFIWFVLGHLILALSAGFMFFAIAEYGNTPDFLEYPLVFFGAFGGAKSLDFLADRMRSYLPGERPLIHDDRKKQHDTVPGKLS